MTDLQQLKADLISFRLHYLAENLEEICQRADQANGSHQEFLDHIVRLETVEKSRRSTERRLKEASIGKFKPMDQFDWRWPEQIDKTRIEQIMKLGFVKEAANLILAGPQGVGKTMLSRNIAWKAVMSGYTVRFTTTAKMVGDLGSAKQGSVFESRLAKYTKPQLLVLDEVGYLSFDCQAADLLFEVVSRRYEAGSIMMTTNMAFKDWDKVFPGAACLTAMIDRLTHHCDILTIQGKSFRHKESSERNSTKKTT
jgi:DNA replication protein DnaC